VGGGKTLAARRDAVFAREINRVLPGQQVPGIRR
jgi:hypothetical protein